jgi:hypothetical protein
MEPKRLERARDHLFSASVDDSGARLCEANVPYGLAKLHWVQEQLGLPQDATFVASPDCTITRNVRRWQQGIGYGGVYEWSGDFAVLDIKTNSCGMIVGSLPEFPELEDVRARLHQLDELALTLDGIELDNDLTESNHFVDVFEVSEDKSTEKAPGGARYFFIMHSSGHELRGATAHGPGLYFDQSEDLHAMARILETPWGSMHILEKERATEWYQYYLSVQDFTHRRRELIAKHLFGDPTVVVNATHQGLVRGMTQANVGCYTYDDPLPGQEPLFPLTLSPTLPAFLVRGGRNVTDGAIETLGWGDRLDKLGVADRIQGTNLLPHGGGYLYPQFKGVARVEELGPDDRRFVLEPSTPGVQPEVIEAPRGMKYGYRGLEVKERMEELELGKAVVHLDLKYVLTA